LPINGNYLTGNRNAAHVIDRYFHLYPAVGLEGWGASVRH